MIPLSARDRAAILATLRDMERHCDSIEAECRDLRPVVLEEMTPLEFLAWAKAEALDLNDNERADLYRAARRETR